MQIIALCFYGRALEAGRRIQETPLTQAVILIAVIVSDNVPIEAERISAALTHHIADDARGDAVGIPIAFQIRPYLRRGVAGGGDCGFGARILRCAVPVNAGIIDGVLMRGTAVGGVALNGVNRTALAFLNDTDMIGESVQIPIEVNDHTCLG